MTALRERVELLELLLADEKAGRAASERTLAALAEEFDRVAADRAVQMKRALYLEGVLHAIYGEAKAVVGVVERLDRIESLIPVEASGEPQIGLPQEVAP